MAVMVYVIFAHACMSVSAKQIFYIKKKIFAKKFSFNFFNKLEDHKKPKVTNGVSLRPLLQPITCNYSAVTFFFFTGCKLSDYNNVYAALLSHVQINCG